MPPKPDTIKALARKANLRLLLILPICVLAIICTVLGIYLHLSNGINIVLINEKHALNCRLVKMTEHIIYLERNIKVHTVSADIDIGHATFFMTEEALLRYTMNRFV